MSAPIPSKLDSSQVLPSVFNQDEGTLRVSLNGTLVSEKYDYVEVTYPTNFSEYYYFKLGGPSGDLIATVAIQYTDSTKANLESVYRY